MKIAVFYNLKFGGAKRVVQEHVKGLVRLGNQVDLYTTVKQPDIFDPSLFAAKNYIYDYSSENITTPFIKIIKKDTDVFIKLRNLHKRIAEDIDSRKYDLVLVHPDNLTQAPFILRYLKTKSVYFCQEPLRIVYEYSLRPGTEIKNINRVYEETTRLLRKRIDRENALSATYIIANSFFGRERIIEAYNRFPVISNLGVDESVFKPLKIVKENNVLFLAEKEEKVYGYEFAQKAISLIPKNIRPKLKDVSGVSGPKKLSEKEIVRNYNRSIASLSLSFFDTFGLVPLESMSCAVPAIAFNVAGYRETIIDKKTGFLVEFDPSEIADKITFLIRNPDKAKLIGEQGRDWVVKNWTWDKQTKKLNSILKKFKSS